MAPAEHRALFIAPTLPAASGNGLAIRLGLFAEALVRVARTDLLVIPMFGQPTGDALVGRLGLETQVVDPGGRVETQFQLLSRLADPAARLAAFRQYGRPTLSARLSAPVLAEARDAIAGRHYDLMHVGRGYMLPAIELAGDAVVTADLDEDDAWSWRSLAKIRSSADAARWALAEAAAADRSLSQFAPRCRVLFISGPADGRRLARRHPGVRPVVVPNPAPPSLEPTPHTDDGRTVLFVGSFGYEANVDGLDWFVRHVWPLIWQARPMLRLVVAGANLPARFVALDRMEGTEVRGAVPDLAPLYQAAMLAIAPLRAGGGTRLKLIEAASFGVPAVSTTLAARGLSFGSSRGMWIADAPAGFAAAVIDAADRPDERARRAAFAQRVVRRGHARERLVEQLACRFAGLLAK